MISGNHDSDDRLNFGKVFFESRKVFIASVFNGTLEKQVVSDGENEVHFYLLPFVKASQVRHFYPEETIENYEDAVRVILDHGGYVRSRSLCEIPPVTDWRKGVKNMKAAVRYYTKTGNTKRLAEAVAKAIGVEALPISTPISEPVDVLFLGNSYYAFSIDPEVGSFVRALDKNAVGRIVNFGSAAMMNSTRKKVKAEADKAGIPVDEREFHCKGEFKGIHKGRPNDEDLKAITEFAVKIMGPSD